MIGRLAPLAGGRRSGDVHRGVRRAGIASVCLLLVSLALPALGVPQEIEGVVPGRLRAGDTVEVVFWPGDSLRAARLLAGLRAHRSLPALPGGLPSGVELYLAPDERTFVSLTGGDVPEWGSGVAVPGRDRIVLPPRGSPRSSGWGELRTLRHEWAHLGLHQYLPGLRVPRWFDEGYAEWASGGWDATRGWRLSLAFATGAAPPLDSLELGWPRDRATADLSYMLSATAVEYIAHESGERGLTLFLRRFREGGSFEAALRSTFGVTSAQLEEDWHKYVKRRYGWLLFVSNSAVTWGVLASLLAVLFWIRRRRDRERMARLRATEPPDRPAFWLAESSDPDEGASLPAPDRPGDGEGPPHRGEQ